MFNKILVALDRSSEASVVFKQALTVAQPEISKLLLFHSLNWEKQEIRPWISVGTLGDVSASRDWDSLRHESLQKEIEQTKDWLETYALQATAQNTVSEWECRVGNPGLWICDRAKAWGADLIVIGRRGHRGLSEIILGSVSNYVIHHAPCSVFVVQGLAVGEVDESVVVGEVDVGT